MQLVVGSYAYLLPWTTVVLRCPTRHFRKGHIRWLKEGKPLFSLPNLSITSLGYVKIQQVRASDAGIYTCVAGQAREHFVLQIIGNKHKLSVPESWLLEQQKVGRSDVTSARELPISLNQYNTIVERLLELKGFVQDEKYIADKPDSGEKNRSTLEEERADSELSVPVVLVADTKRLDEIAHNLGGQQGERLIAELLAELTVTQDETNESTLHPPESSESSTQSPIFYKPNMKVHTSRARNPVIIQRSKKVVVTPQSEMIVYVGMPVLLQKPVASLVLKCESLGSPEPSLTWTKNGKELRYNSR